MKKKANNKSFWQGFWKGKKSKANHCTCKPKRKVYVDLDKNEFTFKKPTQEQIRRWNSSR